MVLPTYIPQQRGSFIGRSQECAKLEAALDAGERLISIIGPSGMGKTSLAREIARRTEPSRFAEGRTWFCDLSSVRTRADLVALVSHVLGLASGGRTIREAQIAQALANRGRLLLLLDNCQHLAPEARLLVGSWLDRAPALGILATSLIPLELEGELIFELGPLDLQAAVDLYEQGAQRVWAGRTFFSGEQRAIVELVQHLDRYPLAIELAAARVKAVPPRLMLSQIGDRFALLRARGGQALNSLEQAIRYSWELLAQEERIALARASIFSGGFTLEAAEEVLAPDDPADPSRQGAASVLELLESLREKALLQLDESGALRFSLYESVQAFAARELEHLGASEETASRHSSFFLRYAETWLAQVDGANGPDAIARLTADRENLLEVHRRLAKRAPAEAARAGLALCFVVARTGAPVAEKDLLDETIAAARRAKDPGLLAHCLRRRTAMRRRDGLPEELCGDLDEALVLAQLAGEQILEGLLWGDRAGVYLFQDRLAEAEAALARAQAIEEAVDDPMLIGSNRMSAGEFAVKRGDPRGAYEEYRAALAAFRRCGNLQYQARTLINLSWASIARGDLQEARARAEEALRIFRSVGDPSSEADAHLALGGIEREAGRLPEAEAHLRTALAAHRQFGNRRFEGQTLWNLGLLAMERGELAATEARLGEAYALFEEAQDAYSMVRLLPLLAANRAIRGKIDEAVAGFAKARRHFEADSSRSDLEAIEVMEGFVDLARAQLASRELRPREAAAFRERAAARLRSPPGAGNPSVQLGSLRRILASAIERYAGSDEAGSARAAAEGAAEGEVLLVGPGAAWFERPGSPKVQLGERSARRKLLQALLESRLLTPGRGLSAEQMFEIGWSGLEVHPAAAANRVYDSVSALRRLGLGDVLLRNADGYLISPRVRVVHAEPRGGGESEII